MFFRWCLLIFVLLLTGCYATQSPAPVVDGWKQEIARQKSVIVKKGDTLYSIAFRYGMDYRALAKLNGIRAPYDIKPGKRIYLTQQFKKSTQLPKKTNKTVKKPIVKKRIILSKKPIRVSNNPVARWRWPARGKVVNRFRLRSKGLNNKGIDISGRYGSPILATAAGRVVYAGDGLRAYGKLIIVKHNNNYLSAYGYNSKILVKRGQRVKAGQRIALMGRSDSGKVMLHFEIRRAGKPVNPLNYLGK